MGNDTSMPCGDYDDYVRDRSLKKEYAWSDTNNTSAQKFDKNGNLITSSDRAETRDTRGGWFWTAFLAALVPIILLFISQLVMARRGNGFRWRLWHDDSGRIVLWIVYIWIFLLFVGIVWYGWKMAITTRASQNMRTLIGALFVFWNLAAMVALLVMGFSVNYSRVDGHWAAQFPVFVAFACFCWYLFGIVWFAMIWRRLNRKQRRAGAFDHKANEDIMPEDDDVNIRTTQNNNRTFGNNNRDNYNNSNYGRDAYNNGRNSYNNARNNYY